MIALSERLLADFGCLDPVYVDGIAGVLNLGVNFATLYFRWHPVQSEAGIIYEQVPALYVIRPRTSILVPTGSFARIVDGQAAPLALPLEAVALRH